MKRPVTSLGIASTATLVAALAAGMATAQPDVAPTYAHAPGVTFEPVAAGVWSVTDPWALSAEGEGDREWHRGVEVAPDGTVWVWGPGGLRTLGGTPIGDDFFDPDEWSGGTSPFWSKAHQFAVAVDGTPWAIFSARTRASDRPAISSVVRSFDGSAWTTHELDWEEVAPRRTDSIWAPLIEALPDGSVWVVWEVSHARGVEQLVARFDGHDWTMLDFADELQRVLAVAGTADGDVWLVGIEEDVPVLLWWHAGEWQRAHPPSSPSPLTGLAVGPDGTLWLTVSRTDDPGCDMPARLAHGTWSSYPPEGDDGWCVHTLFGLDVGPDGSAWFSGLGVAALDDAGWRHYLDDMDVPVLDLDVAPDGSVWIAGPEGLFVIDPAAA